MRSDRVLPRFLFVAFGLSGASALVFEVVWTRALSTIVGSSTHALSTMLAAFMAGLSVGGAVGAFASGRVRDPVRAFALCELGIGLAGVAVAPVIRGLTPLYIASYYAFHDSFAAFYAVQFAIAFLVMGVPTTLMGMTFPLVVRLFTEWRGEAGRQAGRLYAVNTMGALAGALAAGFLLIPSIGVARTALLAAALNVTGAVAILALRRGLRQAGASAAAAALLALVTSRIPTAAPTFSYGYAGRFGSAALASRVADGAGAAEVLFHHEGAEGEVWLVRGHRQLGELALVNGSRLEGGETVAFGLLAHLPYLTARLIRPVRTVLSVGLGSGHTLRALAATPVEAIDSVEISEGIVEANRRVLNPDLFADRRIRHVVADGRNHLLVHRGTYDLVVVSPSWAVEEASASMLTREFFALAARRLSPDGVIGVWTDFSLMDDQDMTRVLRAFAASFRHVSGWSVPGGDVVLVGSNAARYPDEGAIARLAALESAGAKERFTLALADATPRPASLAGAYEDDLPVVEFHNARNLVVGALTRRR